MIVLRPARTVLGVAFLRFIGGAAVGVCVAQVIYVLVGRILRRRGKSLARPSAAAGSVVSDDPRWAPIDQEIARGHPIEAIRMTRQVWGLPFEEAKALVQSRPKV